MKGLEKHKSTQDIETQRNIQTLRRGFTIIELMIVIAIITLLAIVLIPKASIGKQHAKATGILQNERQVKAFVELHKDKGDSVEESLMKEKEFEDMKSPINKVYRGVGTFDNRQNKCIILCKNQDEVKELRVGQLGVCNGKVYRGVKTLTKDDQKVMAQVDKEKEKEQQAQKEKEKEQQAQKEKEKEQQYEEKQVEKYVEQHNTNFNKTIAYNEGGFTGTLNKEGNPQDIGNYVSSQSKSITNSKTSSNNSFVESISYNNGGYIGTLTKSGSSIVISGSYTNGHNESSRVWVGEDSKEITTTAVGHTVIDKEGDHVDGTNYLDGKSVSTFCRYSYSSGGYTGTLRLVYDSAAEDIMDKSTYKIAGKYTVTLTFKGTVTRPAHYETTSHWVSGSDTRVWKQNYSGTVTKPSSGSHKYKQKYVGTVKRLKK